MRAGARERDRTALNAIVSLRAVDVLLSREQIVITLAAVGQPIAWAEHWPHGALRWRAAHDKMGYETVTPLSALGREALDTYFARNPRAGDVPLFRELRNATRCASRDIAEHWLRQAEKKAGLPRLARGGYHPFRRQFASERRHLNDADLMAGGGGAPSPSCADRTSTATARAYSMRSNAPNPAPVGTDQTQENRKAGRVTR